MKKFLMVLFVMAVASSVALAGVRIDWYVGWAGYDHDAGANPTSGNYLLDANSAIWQLIYAGADGEIDRIDDPLNPVQDVAAWQANNYLLPASEGGDDVLWGQRIIPMGGGAATGGTAYDPATEWGTDMWVTDGSTTFERLDWNTAGFVYQRVFQVGPSGLVHDGTYFTETGLFTFSTTFTAGDGLVPQTFLVDGDAPTYDSVSHGFSPQSAVSAVPEPATMGLLGLGALVMAIRRRRS